MKKILEAASESRNLDQKVKYLATSDNQYSEPLKNGKPLEDLKNLRWEMSESVKIIS